MRKKKNEDRKNQLKKPKKKEKINWNIKIGFNATTIFIIVVILLLIILPLLCLQTGCLDTTNYYYKLNDTAEALSIVLSI